jgi:hypothetical protein
MFSYEPDELTQLAARSRPDRRGQVGDDSGLHLDLEWPSRADSYLAG